MWYGGQLTSPERPTLTLLWVPPPNPVASIKLQPPQIENSGKFFPDHLPSMLGGGGDGTLPVVGVCLSRPGCQQVVFGPRSCRRAFRTPSWPDLGGWCGVPHGGTLRDRSHKHKPRVDRGPGKLSDFVGLSGGCLWVSQPLGIQEASHL